MQLSTLVGMFVCELINVCCVLQIQEVLGEYEAVWRKHQRHSGMIRSDASAARAAPAANLLRGPTSTTQFALPPPPSKEVLLIKSTAAVREEAEEAYEARER